MLYIKSKLASFEYNKTLIVFTLQEIKRDIICTPGSCEQMQMKITENLKH
jgi:hypothetical protein